MYPIDRFQTVAVLPRDIATFANIVSFAFVCPLAVQFGWTPDVEANLEDLEYPGLTKFGRLRSDGANTQWSAKFKDLINDAHAKSLTPVLSIGGAAWGLEWTEGSFFLTTFIVQTIMFFDTLCRILFTTSFESWCGKFGE